MQTENTTREKVWSMIERTIYAAAMILGSISFYAYMDQTGYIGNKAVVAIALVVISHIGLLK